MQRVKAQGNHAVPACSAMLPLCTPLQAPFGRPAPRASQHKAFCAHSQAHTATATPVQCRPHSTHLQLCPTLATPHQHHAGAVAVKVPPNVMQPLHALQLQPLAPRLQWREARRSAAQHRGSAAGHSSAWMWCRCSSRCCLTFVAVPWLLGMPAHPSPLPQQPLINLAATNQPHGGKPVKTNLGEQSAGAPCPSAAHHLNVQHCTAQHGGARHSAARHTAHLQRAELQPLLSDHHKPGAGRRKPEEAPQGGRPPAEERKEGECAVCFSFRRPTEQWSHDDACPATTHLPRLPSRMPCSPYHAIRARAWHTTQRHGPLRARRC